MNRIYRLFVLIALPLVLASIAPLLHAQSYTLELTNAYGGGVYHAGDTVNIWAKESPAQVYFLKWTGDVQGVEDVGEWHTRIVMPAASVSLKAEFAALGSVPSFATEYIRGRDTLKRVFYAFPATAPKAVVFLLHGTNGSAGIWTNDFEKLLWSKRLLHEQYAVIAIDAEEVTYDKDFNGDGVYRWDYTQDTTLNVDFRNIRAITDTFRLRSFIPPGTPLVAFGVSAGGAFGTALASMLHWRCAISHHGFEPDGLASVTNTPIQHNMNLYDDHPNVGPAGNQKATLQYDTLVKRGICSRFFMLDHQPVYPERFARNTAPGAMNIDQSIAVFNELKSLKVLDANNYVSISSDSLKHAYIKFPAKFPVLSSLTLAQRNFVESELRICLAAHEYHSDHMAKDLRFLENPCYAQTSAVIDQTDEMAARVHPNPAHSRIQVEGTGELRIYSMIGELLVQSSESSIDVSHLSSGVYVVRRGQSSSLFVVD